MSEPEVGGTFAGLDIESQLGEGGMSVVYLARDRALGRPVALKVMARTLSDDESFRSRFRSEAQAASSIDHPNVVPIYGFGDEDGRLWLAMRYVDGSDLRALLHQKGRLGLDETIAIVEQVASALDALHERGLTHRDVKPDNILLGRTSTATGAPLAYLADFGITRSTTSQLTQTGQVVGTLAYASPEQLRAETVDGRSDQYSLACVVFECLSGQRPFVRDTDTAVILAHVSEVAPAPSEVAPGLPPAVDGVVLRALAKPPSARFESCTAFAAALRQAAAGGGPAGGDQAGPPAATVVTPVPGPRGPGTLVGSLGPAEGTPAPTPPPQPVGTPPPGPASWTPAPTPPPQPGVGTPGAAPTWGAPDGSGAAGPGGAPAWTPPPDPGTAPIAWGAAGPPGPQPPVGPAGPTGPTGPVPGGGWAGPGPSGPPPARSSGSRAVWIVVAAGVFVLLLVVGGVVALTRSSTPGAVTTTTTSTTSTTARPTTTATEEPSTEESTSTTSAGGYGFNASEVKRRTTAECVDITAAHADLLGTGTEDELQTAADTIKRYDPPASVVRALDTLTKAATGEVRGGSPAWLAANDEVKAWEKLACP